MTQNHTGHRERMRERFRTNLNFDGFADHEILEMLLFYIFPRGNTNELAHNLIIKFGSVKGVLNASPEELMAEKACGENCALAIKFFNALTCYASRQELGGVDARDYTKMLEYVNTFFYGEKAEKIKVFCISNDCKIQSVSDAGTGTNNRVAIDYKELTKIILNSGCNYIVIAHNHPNSENTPSQEDITQTRKLISYLSMLEITVLDHYIVGTNGVSSMRNSGLIHDI